MNQKQSPQEARTELVTRLVRELVREVSDTKDEKTLQSYEQQAFSIIRNHRSISINRYEVRRKLDDLKEKFIVANFKEYADELERLCDIVLNDPVCLQHYEIDIQWSLLELLFSLAYSPTKSLRRNQQKFIFETPKKSKEITFVHLKQIYMKNLLKKDFIPIQRYDEDSDLSDWSDTEPESPTLCTENTLKGAEETGSSISSEPSVFLLPHLPALQAPVKQKSYELIEFNEDLRNNLRQIINSNSCVSDRKNSSTEILTHRMEGNFAVLLNDYIRKRTSGFLCFTEPKIASEFVLLRELIWMFYAPQKCKYFSIISGKTKLQKNVTVPSVSAPTLAAYLEHNILCHVDQMHTLQRFLRDVYDCTAKKLPKTFEYYAANLKSLLKPIQEKFVEVEECIARQTDFEINTLITLRTNVEKYLRRLQIISSIHEAAVLDNRKYASHIASSYLLTALMHFNNNSATIIESNLAISLFLTSVKAFCDIVDCWWNEGRLDDWQNEFLVEYNSDQSISFRMYSKDKEKAFFVPKYVSKTIGEDRFMHLMQDHSLEAGYTLNLLYEISRIGDLRSVCGAVRANLYDVFIDDLFCQIRSIAMENENDQVETAAQSDDDITDAANVDNDFCYEENLTTNDEFLLLLFKSYEKSSEKSNGKDTCDGIANSISRRKNSLEIFNELEKYKQMLPLEELILNSFDRILRERITIANKYVVDLYRENFEILRHLRNIRKVLLFEASDVMQQFYTKLFKQMEAGHSWANAFVLTMQLDDTISSKHPDMSSLFRIEINSVARVNALKVFEAMESLTIGYSFSNELSKIITDNDMKVYNDVFRFLLKVKWALITLESLKFSRQKRRPAYAPLEIGNFLMRRLEQLRFWLFYGVQCVHSHLMMHVLQALGAQLDEKILQCENVREMESVHKSYLKTLHEHCFLAENLSKIKIGIEQMLNLVYILRSEWWSCHRYLNHNLPLSIDVSDGKEDSDYEDRAITAQIDAIELTYIRCHQYLANMLNNEVYIVQNSFLSGLSAAFNTSLPC